MVIKKNDKRFIKGLLCLLTIRSYDKWLVIAKNNIMSEKKMEAIKMVLRICKKNPKNKTTFDHIAI